MKIRQVGLLSVILVSLSLFNAHSQKYDTTWESLSKYNEAPEWFKDAKFGIYFHWGVYSVPAFGDEWYPREMLFDSTKEYRHHLEKYGHPSKFGYHDFIPMFKAEKFNADEWAELFKKAGARFAGPVAEHHDGFAMWASKATPWNAKEMGPHKDIVGEMEKAIHGRNMKFITTFHHERQLQRYADKPGERRFWDSHYPFIKGMPSTSTDPKLRLLYGYMPEQEWLEKMWLGKLKEVIDGYHPDIIWFDLWLDRIPENYLQKFCAYYINAAATWNKDVVIVRKQEDLPSEVSILDIEKARMNRLHDKVWMTDETVSMGSWCYTEDLKIKPSVDILHELIDIVSKNGVLLLNVSPMASGIIPDDQKQLLLDLGNWLSKYGEAIYETRPWYTFGEGPTKEPEGDHKNTPEFLKIKYSAKDIRYTKKGNTIYAVTLGWPGDNTPILLQSFDKSKINGLKSIQKVTMLGSDEKIQWDWQDNGLYLTTPKNKPDDKAVVFKIETAE